MASLPPSHQGREVFDRKATGAGAGAGAPRELADNYAYEMQERAVSRKWQGTEADRKDMSALGRVQELRVGGFRSQIAIAMADVVQSETSSSLQ